MKKSRKAEREERPERRGGFLLLYRKLREHPRYAQPGFVQFWIHCLLSARFQPGRELFDGKPITLKAGQFISSRREICEATRLSNGMVARLIFDLQVDQQLDQLPGKKHSMFTVLKWGEYQGGDPLVDPQVDPRVIHDRSVTDPSLIHEPHKPQAGVQKNDANKGTRKQGNNDPKSIRGVGGRIVKEGGGAAGAVNAFVVPSFEAIPKGTFPRELKEMSAAVKSQLKRLKAREDAWEWSERVNADTARAMEWTRGELDGCVDETKRERLTKELQKLEAVPKERVRGRMVPEAKAVLEALEAREVEIELAMAGGRV